MKWLNVSTPVFPLFIGNCFQMVKSFHVFLSLFTTVAVVILKKTLCLLRLGSENIWKPLVAVLCEMRFKSFLFGSSAVHTHLP